MAIDQSEPAPEPAVDLTKADGEPDPPEPGGRLPDQDEPDESRQSAPLSQPALLPPRAWAVAPHVLYLVAAVFLLNDLWRAPGSWMLLDNYQDQVWFEWLLTNGANSLAHWDNPLFTDKLNAPYGLNLMANTSVLALALPLAPVTWLFGADVTFVLITTLALAGTASAWYVVLNRLLNHRVAAAVGGAFCGFAPSMISQATGHPNIAGQYLLPFVVLAVLRLGAPGRTPLRRGLELAGLVVVQAFVNEELLFLTALGLGVFLIGYGLARPAEIRLRAGAAARSIGVTTVVAGLALAYPLYVQFFGRGNYRGLPDYILLYGADLGGYWSFARRSVAGDADITQHLAQGPTEENSFFGWPLLLALVVIVVWLRRDVVVRALAVTGALFAVLSLGSEPKLGGAPFDLIAPWGWLDGLPLFDSVVPTRLALVVTPVIGCLVAIAVARYAAVARRLAADALLGPEARLFRRVGVVLLALMLLPLTPTPLPVFERPAVPTFFTSGEFRAHVPAGGVVLAVPPGWTPNLHAMQWQTGADLGFRIFGGYYLAPNPDDPDRVAMFGPVYPESFATLSRVAERGEIVESPETFRAQAAADFRGTGVTTLLLPAHHAKATELRELLDQVVGPGEEVGGMWVWDVRPLR